MRAGSVDDTGNMNNLKPAAANVGTRAAAANAAFC